MAEAVARSPDTELWRSSEERSESLPLLLTLLSSIEDRQRNLELEAVLPVSFKSLHFVLEHVVITAAFQQGQQGCESSNIYKWDPLHENFQVRIPSRTRNGLPSRAQLHVLLME